MATIVAAARPYAPSTRASAASPSAGRSAARSPSLLSAPTLHARRIGSPLPAGRPAAGAPRIGGRLAGWRALRYKEKEIEDGEVHDWRIKQMCEVAHRYYADVWSRGDMGAADEVLDEEASLKDELWGSHSFVGRDALKKQVAAFRRLYPDLQMEIDNIGVYGTQDLAIRWSARATNLGGAHPTHHYTHFSGISSLRFSDDRKRVAEIVTYRQPTSEEMTNKCEVSWRREPSTTEIQLVPLHVSTANYDYLPELKKKKKKE
mmetsp:Transcript_44837/g.113495  ORF Transcript_44837/g.113495 Transcript_44837/m.113495 type:complete len:261 (-) Transcript_44837:209-991(-)